MSTTPEGSGRKPNRRGVAAREQLLSTALRLLGGGQTEAVSINLVAKEAGLSWGSVQNLFGDSDGFWSAVVELIIDAGTGRWAEPESDTVAGRVREVVRIYHGILRSPEAIAIETIRAGLPRPRTVLARTHPKTAASLTHLDELFEQGFLRFFDGLEDPKYSVDRTRDVAAVIPSAMRGLHADEVFGTSVDIDKAHETLVAALIAYIER